MKVLLLTDGLYPFTMGGMQKHSYYLIKFLSTTEIDFDVVIPKKKDDQNNYDETLFESKINFIEVYYNQSSYFPGHYVYDSYNYSKQIYNKLHKEFSNYDYIYAQGFTAWRSLKEKKSQGSRPPIGVNLHGLNMYQTSTGIKSFWEKQLFKIPANFCLKNADVVYSLGGKLTAILNNLVDESSIIETPIGIEEKWLDNVNFGTTKNRRFVFIGRYEKLKGIELLNKVIQKNSNTDFSFEFIGPIPESKQVSHPAVTYHGAVYEEDRIKEILDRSDVLFCPSYSEGMPTVILEAMSRGLAVGATDVGAVSCLVSGKTGWLMESGNLEQLNRVFLDAISIDSDELMKRKKNAHELIKNRYTWDKVAEINLNAIKQILARKKEQA